MRGEGCTTMVSDMPNRVAYMKGIMWETTKVVSIRGKVKKTA